MDPAIAKLMALPLRDTAKVVIVCQALVEDHYHEITMIQNDGLAGNVTAGRITAVRNELQRQLLGVLENHDHAKTQIIQARLTPDEEANILVEDYNRSRDGSRGGPGDIRFVADSPAGSGTS